MSQLLSYLPPFEGYLPKWLFLVSIVSAANSLQSYQSVAYANNLYNTKSPKGTPPSNPLSARTFATWTFLSAVIRMYAAYNITTPVAYDLAMWSFGIALAHFLTEWLAQGTGRLRGRFLGPLAVASGSLGWMFLTREGYFENGV